MGNTTRQQSDRDYLIARAHPVAFAPNFTDCWEWRGFRNTKGYGICHRYPTVREFVHRLSHRAFIGPIPDGYHVDHLCFNRACFNPEHLEAVTPAVNNQRANLRQTRGRGYSLFQRGDGRWTAAVEEPRGPSDERVQKRFTSRVRDVAEARADAYIAERGFSAHNRAHM